MQEARDDVYCHLIARRTIARAAMHLGVDSMSKEALDALSSVLIAFLERIGKALAYSVESSGRSSAHCHAIDALRAVELCTSTAVKRVHMVSSAAVVMGTGSTSIATGLGGNLGSVDAIVDGKNLAALASHRRSDSSAAATVGCGSGEAAQDMSWKGLAAFCFGPDWHTSPPQLLELQQQAEQVSERSTAGKVGLSSVLQGPRLGTISHFSVKGWNAPYPDELPVFPETSSTAKVANPHLLSSVIAETFHTKLHDVGKDADLNGFISRRPLTLQEELEDLSDSFLIQSRMASWGSFDKSKQHLLQHDSDRNNDTRNTFTAYTASEQTISAPTTSASSTTAGGAMNSSNFKRKAEDDADDKAAATRKTKMVAFSLDNDKYSDEDRSNDGVVDNCHEGLISSGFLEVNSLIPEFYPLFPRASDAMRRTVIDAGRSTNAAEEVGSDTFKVDDLGSENKLTKNKSPDDTNLSSNDADGALQVRSALVSLGQQYWGSGWEDTESTKELITTLEMTKIIVPAGRGSNDTSLQPQIVPLGRASGSRVSRILEGSMDASNPV